ncbi:heterokaryon incompatibility protein-domain-containing protein [Hypoxylon cercidicola]|nr:heterokaryon incompatibility protein-domain-containing protein [Hypoxylon cercidicola]
MEELGCHRCRAVFQAGTAGQSTTKHDLHRNPQDLIAGLQSKCWWCAKAMQSVTSALHSYQDIDNDEFCNRYPDFRTSVVYEGSAWQVECWSQYMTSPATHAWPYDKIGCVFQAHEIKNDNDSYHNQPSHIPSPNIDSYDDRDMRIGPNTNSDESFAFITRQLTQCRQRHDLCRDVLRDWYPTRLLEINQQSGTISLRVIETEESQVCSAYITLSHCWGEELPLRLLSENIDTFRVGIPTDKVPILYMDAALIAIRTGVRYIWIDSLCIIQDSSDDWRRESYFMFLVYYHGLFNIEATFSENCSHTLFSSRHPNLLVPHKVTNPATGSTYLWTESNNELWASKRFIETDSLYKRGWVLQERMLAKRSVIYARRGIFFRCFEQRTSEVHELDYFPAGQRQGFKLFEPLDLALPSREDYFKDWREIQQHYSNTAITMPGDKLIALAGITEFIGYFRNSKYLAGLWEHTLLEDLMWFRQGGTGRPADYRAPTWSWASVDSSGSWMTSPISECTTCLKSVPKVVGVSTTPVVSGKKGEYGEIRNAQLTLNGYLYPLFRKRQSTSGTLEHHVRAALGELFPSFDGDPLQFDVSIDDPSLDASYQANLPIPRQCFVMPLYHTREQGELYQIILLLLAAVTPAPGIFQRIGICRLTGGAIPSPSIKTSKTPQYFFKGLRGIPKPAVARAPGIFQRIGIGRLIGRVRTRQYFFEGLKRIQKHNKKLCLPDSPMMMSFMEAMGSQEDIATISIV